ncbi:glycosyltransferase family 87 protein [Micrococcaceae bacterium Sec5.8]
MGKLSRTRAHVIDGLPRSWPDFASKYPLFMKLALVLIWPLGLLLAYMSLKAAVLTDALGQDAHAYWLAAQGELVYGRAPGERDAYLYSPAFVTVLRPVALLPWHLFLALWICLEAAVLCWLLKPLQRRWSVPAFMLCLPEIVVGNIYILLAAAAVVGLHKPAMWAFPILTKVTAGVGLLWFAVRGEWRLLGQGVGGFALAVLVFYALDPAAWQAWLQFLVDHRDGTPDTRVSFLLRCLLAVVLVLVGARKQWPLLLAPAMVLASPVLVGLIPLTLLAAVPRLTGMASPGAKDGLPAPKTPAVRGTPTEFAASGERP